MAAKKEKSKRHINTPATNAPQVKKIPVKLPVRWMALAVFLLGFLLYANTIGHDYVLDDFSLIKENFVTKRGLDGIPTLWSTHARHGYWNSPGELYRPLPQSMFALEWQLAPDTPALSHFMNVLLYALGGVVMLLALLKILKNYHPLLPLLGTLFFMAHPVHTEVVANIKSRDEILMLLLVLGSLRLLWNYVEKEKNSALIAALLLYLASLFCKENAVTFVAIMPLVLYFFSSLKLPKIAILTALYAVPALVFILVRKAVIGGMVNPTDTYILDNFLVGAKDTATYTASAFLLLGKYLWTLLFPYQLGSDFGYNQIPLTSWGDWRSILSLLAWAGLGVIALLGLKKKSLWSFFILFFLINFSIFTNLFIKIGTSYGERLLYAASPAFTLALALALMKLFKTNENNSTIKSAGLFQNKGLWAVSALILFMYSGKTILRNADWKTSYTLYEADVQTAPNAAKLNFHYGLEIIQKGLKTEVPEEKKQYFERGKAQFEKAIQIYPQYHDAYSQLGLVYYRMGEPFYDQAMANYEKAISYKNNFPLVYSNMGIIYFSRGDMAKAQEVYEKAVHYDPRMVDARRNLGAVFAMKKDFPKAIEQFSEALKYAPDDATINFYLGSSYRDSGQPEKGQPYLDKAYRLDPKLKK